MYKTMIENWFEEKESINELFEIKGKENMHFFDKDEVKQEFLNLPKELHNIIIRKITEIELRNVNPNDFIEYFLRGLIKEYEG
jgi:hypothetical protein